MEVIIGPRRPGAGAGQASCSVRCEEAAIAVVRTSSLACFAAAPRSSHPFEAVSAVSGKEPT